MGSEGGGSDCNERYRKTGWHFGKNNYNVRYMKASKPSAPERPSRRQFDRDEALAAALEVFWRHGYAGTSMAMLLEAMDLNAPSLYAAFGGKEQLFQAAVERYVQHYGSKILAPLMEPIGAREAIEQTLRNAVATVASPRNPPGCLLSFGAINVADHDSSPVAVLRGVRGNIEKRLRERLDRAVADGDLPPATDTARLARFFRAVMAGIQLRSLDKPARADLETIVEDAMAVWPASRADR